LGSVGFGAGGENVIITAGPSHGPAVKMDIFTAHISPPAPKPALKWV